MAKRRICNYAYASQETPRKNAIYQRGQFYIVERNQRRGDRRRYAAYINDSLLGFGGSLVRVKRFINDAYKAFPFASDVNQEMTQKIQRFARRAQMQLRDSFAPSKMETQKRASQKKNQDTKRKQSTGKQPAALPTMSAAQKNLAKSTIAAAQTGEQVQDVIQFLKQHKQTAAVKQIVKDAERRRDALRAPRQGRLF